MDETKSQFFSRINKIDKPLTILKKKKIKKHTLLKSEIKLQSMAMTP